MTVSIGAYRPEFIVVNAARLDKLNLGQIPLALDGRK